MAAIATVVNIKGEAFAVNAQGVRRQLHDGDKLQEGEVLVTAPGSTAELEMDGGKHFTVPEHQTFVIDASVASGAETPEAASAALAEGSGVAQKVIQALQSGDPNALIEAEATAAGLAGQGGADEGGVSFVRLLRIAEGVSPVGFEFGINAHAVQDVTFTGAVIEETSPVTTTNEPPTIGVQIPPPDQTNGVPFGSAAEATVFEAGLPGGSAPGNGNIVSGNFQIADPDGLGDVQSVTINGQTIAIGSLVGSVITTPTGVLTITGYANGVASFSYELTTVTTDVPNQAETDTFTLTVSDAQSTSAPATITITIVDDVPTAVADGPVTVTEDGTSLVSGNVLTNDIGGADAPKAFDAWDATANATAMADLANYGTLVLNPDGSYTFTLDNSLAAVQALTAASHLSFDLTYTMEDADGDTSSSTLTININGADDGASVVTAAITGADATVFEHGLTSLADTSETTTGTFTVSATDGIASITVGGMTFTLAQLQALSTTNQTINTGQGILTLTDYSGTAYSGTVSYSYTLSATIDNDSIVPTGNDTVTLTDFNDSVHITVNGVGGTTAGDDLVVRVVDDTPMGSSDSGIVANTVNAVFTGDSGIIYGADGKASATISADTLPTGWTATQVDSTHITLSNQDGTASASVVLNPDGTYTFTVLDTVDPTVLTQTLEGLIPGNVSTNSLTLIIADPNNPADPLHVTISGSGSSLKSSNQGMGIDNDLISGSEKLTMNFDHNIGDITYTINKLSDGDTMTWVAKDANGNILATGHFSPPTGTGENDTIIVDLKDTTLDSGTLANGFDTIELGSSSGDYRLQSMEVQTSVTPDDASFTFLVTGTDNDGDTATSVIAVTVDGDPTSGGTIAGDTLTGSGLMVGGDGNDTITGSSGSDSLFGSSGDDSIVGGAGNDHLYGDAGNDILVGGTGDDQLTGGLGADTFKWLAGDQGTAGTPAVDTIVDFGNGADKLDLRDLLQGEHSGGATPNLTDYLHFTTAGGSTIVNISTTGHVTDGPTAVDQQIVLQGVDLTAGGAYNTDAAIIANLLATNKLVVDG